MVRKLQERNYHVSEFSNVMVRPVEKLPRGKLVSGLEIRKAGPKELDQWTLTVAQGFAENYPVTRKS